MAALPTSPGCCSSRSGSSSVVLGVRWPVGSAVLGFVDDIRGALGRQPAGKVAATTTCDGGVMSTHTAAATAPAAGSLLHRATNSGLMYWGPGDLYRFLVTGAESGGAYFAMEAYVPPGGGPPPHVHRHEDETFYVVEGQIEFRLADELVTGGAGDFVNVPRGTVHRFHNAGTTPARMILTF